MKKQNLINFRFYWEAISVDRYHDLGIRPTHSTLDYFENSLLDWEFSELKCQKVFNLLWDCKNQHEFTVILDPKFAIWRFENMYSIKFFRNYRALFNGRCSVWKYKHQTFPTISPFGKIKKEA